jgi:hypothetical protein
MIATATMMAKASPSATRSVDRRSGNEVNIDGADFAAVREIHP